MEAVGRQSVEAEVAARRQRWLRSHPPVERMSTTTKLDCSRGNRNERCSTSTRRVPSPEIPPVSHRSQPPGWRKRPRWSCARGSRPRPGRSGGSSSACRCSRSHSAVPRRSALPRSRPGTCRKGLAHRRPAQRERRARPMRPASQGKERRATSRTSRVGLTSAPKYVPPAARGPADNPHMLFQLEGVTLSRAGRPVLRDLTSRCGRARRRSSGRRAPASPRSSGS